MVEVRNSKMDAAEVYAQEYVNANLAHFQSLAAVPAAASASASAVPASTSTALTGLNLQSINPVLLLGGGALLLLVLTRK